MDKKQSARSLKAVFLETSSHVINVLIIAVCAYVVLFVGLSSYYYLKYGAAMLSMMEQGYTVKKRLEARVDGPFPVNATVDQVLDVPLRQDIHFAFPFKTVLPVPLDYTFSVPLDKPLAIPIDHELALDENIRIKAEIPIETEATVRFMNQDITLPVKVVAPIDAVVPIRHKLHLKETIMVTSAEPLAVPLHATFDIPIDVFLKGEIPLDEMIRIPLRADLQVEAEVPGNLPIVMDVNTVINMNRETGLEKSE